MLLQSSQFSCSLCADFDLNCVFIPKKQGENSILSFSAIIDDFDAVTSNDGLIDLVC